MGELARYLGVSEEEVLDSLETAQAYAAVSLDAPRATLDEGPQSLLDVIGTDDHDLALVDASVTVGTAIATVMMAASFAVLLLINLIQAFARRREA